MTVLAPAEPDGAGIRVFATSSPNNTFAQVLRRVPLAPKAW